MTPTNESPDVLAVPRQVIDMLADIMVIDVDDPNGPGWTECPACGASATGHWEYGVYQRPTVPHNYDCPAEFARKLKAGNSEMPAVAALIAREAEQARRIAEMKAERDALRQLLNGAAADLRAMVNDERMTKLEKVFLGMRVAAIDAARAEARDA